MSNVLTFKPRPKPSAPETPELLSGPELRAQIEAGVQAALDLADHYIAVLNGIDGCPDLEDGADAEPSLAAPENHEGSQVVYMRGGDQDREEAAAETVLPMVPVQPLPWSGNGNVLAAAGAMLLEMVVGR